MSHAPQFCSSTPQIPIIIDKKSIFYYAWVTSHFMRSIFYADSEKSIKKI